MPNMKSYKTPQISHTQAIDDPPELHLRPSREQDKTLPSSEDGETLAQIDQRSCECPIPGSVQGQFGWSFEQPGPVEGAPVYGRGF
ncbi:hypothetical protein WISP_98866 [Willisornis vidua]|uniref:Uncharacterized protein n=1 Tax=Willisornis vidua TaxID=1566151 RepID=A0ABQ9CZG1_9PASS|nr:hypothetical protein WISP_98866 [Willisornis vidua]